MAGATNIANSVLHGTFEGGRTISHWQATNEVSKNGTAGFGTESACAFGSHGSECERGIKTCRNLFQKRTECAQRPFAVSPIGEWPHIRWCMRRCLTNVSRRRAIPRLRNIMWTSIGQEGIIDNGTAVCRTARTVV